MNGEATTPSISVLAVQVAGNSSAFKKPIRHSETSSPLSNFNLIDAQDDRCCARETWLGRLLCFDVKIDLGQPAERGLHSDERSDLAVQGRIERILVKIDANANCYRYRGKCRAIRFYVRAVTSLASGLGFAYQSYVANTTGCIMADDRTQNFITNDIRSYQSVRWVSVS